MEINHATENSTLHALDATDRAATVEETAATSTRQFYGPYQLSLAFVRISLPLNVREL
jgi:hypothetical protein